MSDVSSKSVWPTFLSVIGIFALFLLILALARTPAESPDQIANVPEEEQWKMSPEGRRTRLDEVRGSEDAALQSYGWVDQEAGVVRLPLNRAIEVTIAELNRPPSPSNAR